METKYNINDVKECWINVYSHTDYNKVDYGFMYSDRETAINQASKIRKILYRIHVKMKK